MTGEGPGVGPEESSWGCTADDRDDRARTCRQHVREHWAEQLGTLLKQLPGGHNGFAENPETFAPTLRDLLSAPTK